MKILVADDSRVMRQIVIRTLRQAGYGDAEICEATDGAHGLIQFSDFGPDLVLSDWNMPELNGIDMLRSLRASGYTGPFGFVTSEGSPQMRELASTSGADFLVAKPFNADVLREHIESSLGATQR